GIHQCVRDPGCSFVPRHCLFLKALSSECRCGSSSSILASEAICTTMYVVDHDGGPSDLPETDLQPSLFRRAGDDWSCHLSHVIDWHAVEPFAPRAIRAGQWG